MRRHCIIVRLTGFNSVTSQPRYSATFIIWLTMQSISWKITTRISSPRGRISLIKRRRRDGRCARAIRTELRTGRGVQPGTFDFTVTAIKRASNLSHKALTILSEFLLLVSLNAGVLQQFRRIKANLPRGTLTHFILHRESTLTFITSLRVKAECSSAFWFKPPCAFLSSFVSFATTRFAYERAPRIYASTGKSL